MRLIKKLFFTFSLLILFMLVLVIGFFFWAYIQTDYYKYINSINTNDFRYSLYQYSLGEVNQFVIFRHKLDYQNYKKVRLSKVSLGVFNNNDNDMYLYDIYLDPGIDYYFGLTDTEYIVLKDSDFFYFLLNTSTSEILYQAQLESLGTNEIDSYID